MNIVQTELNEISEILHKNVPGAKIIAVDEALIRLEIHQSEKRQVAILLRFPDNYPEENVLVEIKSRTYSTKLLDALSELAEQKSKECLGNFQILHVLKFISSYLSENKLCVAYDEISALKEFSKKNSTEIKLKQKSSCITVVTTKGNYFYKLKGEIPDDYPNKCVNFKDVESNFPVVLVRYLNGQSKEIARQCAEPPLNPERRKTFTPQASLLKSIKFLIEASVGFYEEECPICKKLVLPRDRKDCIMDENNDASIERVYCGHLYHQGCLKKYMQEPPFPREGKTCPASKKHLRSDSTYDMTKFPNKMNKKISTTKDDQDNSSCGLRIAHDRWALNIRVAESRWAQKQARQRELEEVIDFVK